METVLENSAIHFGTERVSRTQTANQLVPCYLSLLPSVCKFKCINGQSLGILNYAKYWRYCSYIIMMIQFSGPAELL